jgi:hypothetical protein
LGKLNWRDPLKGVLIVISFIIIVDRLGPLPMAILGLTISAVIFSWGGNNIYLGGACFFLVGGMWDQYIGSVIKVLFLPLIIYGCQVRLKNQAINTLRMFCVSAMSQTEIGIFVAVPAILFVQVLPIGVH